MRASKEDRDASFAAFMDQAGPALLRTAWFLTGNTDRAQELTQAALVKTYLAWPRIDRDRAHAYARKCLVNHKIDGWRATRHEVLADVTSAGFELASASSGSRSARSAPSGSSSSGSSGSMPSRSGWQPRGSEATAVDDRDDLVRRLSRLPRQQRTVVVLRYYADQSEAAVAEALGISVGSVKSAASRGLATLRLQAATQDQPRTETQPRPRTETQSRAQNLTASSSTEGSLR